MRFLRGRNPQVVVATHSIEIMGDAEPDEVLVVDRGRKRSRFADSLPAVQRVADIMGSPHSLQLARLWNARRFLLIEGDDLDLLGPLYDKLYPAEAWPLDLIPNMSIGGWGGWRYAIGSSMALQNAAGEEIVTYCILDSDYHTENQKDAVSSEAQARSVNLHIWTRKELENYLIVPDAVRRIIASRVESTKTPPTEAIVRKRIDTIAQGFHDEVLYALASEYVKDRSGDLDPKNAIQAADQRLKTLWATPNGRAATAPGKKILSSLSSWSKKRYGVSFGIPALLREIRADEISDEVRLVLGAIHGGLNFPAS
jgi:hypothetical protein